MTPDDRVASTLAGWRETEQTADPGPWEVCGIGDEDIWSKSKGGFVAEAIGPENARLVATARTAFPLLLTAIDAVLKLVDQLEHLKTGPPSGKEDEAAALGLRWCAAQFREAISTALTGKERQGG
jgi:hypothetical protein